MTTEKIEFMGSGDKRLAKVSLPIGTVGHDHLMSGWERVVVTFVDPERPQETVGEQSERLIKRARELARSV